MGRKEERKKQERHEMINETTCYTLYRIHGQKGRKKRQERHELRNETYLLYIMMDTSAGCGTGSGTGRRGTKLTLLKQNLVKKNL